MPFKSWLYCLLVVLLCCPTARGDLVVFDDDFSTSGYSYSTDFFNLSDPGINDLDLSGATFDIIGTGGNPGGYFEVTHFHDVDRDEFGDPFDGFTETSVQSYFDNQSVTYNPGSQGAFDFITFSFDYRTIDFSFDSAFVSISDANGGNFAGFESLVTDGTWATYEVTLDESSFSSRDFAGNLDLQFGFGFSTSGVFIEPDAEQFMIDVDNFSVSITSVPEPSSMLSMGLLGFIFLRRRR